MHPVFGFLYIFITWLITCFPAERTWGDASRSKDANEKHWQVNTYFHTVQLLLSEFLVTRLLISYRTGRRQHLQDRIRLTKASKVSLTIRSSGRGSWRPKEKIRKMSVLFLSVAAMTAQVFVSVNPVLETSLHMSTWVEEWLQDPLYSSLKDLSAEYKYTKYMYICTYITYNYRQQPLLPNGTSDRMSVFLDREANIASRRHETQQNIFWLMLNFILTGVQLMFKISCITLNTVEIRQSIKRVSHF